MTEYAIRAQADKWRQDQAQADAQRDTLIASVRAAHATGLVSIGSLTPLALPV